MEFKYHYTRDELVRPSNVLKGTLLCTYLLYTVLHVRHNFPQLVHRADVSFNAHTHELDGRVV